MAIRQTSSRTVYENRWMRVREDEVKRADGSPGIFGVVEKPDFALIIPKDEGGLWLVEQFRYPVGRRLWEFPQGSWEHDAALDHADATRRRRRVGRDGQGGHRQGRPFARRVQLAAPRELSSALASDEKYLPSAGPSATSRARRFLT